MTSPTTPIRVWDAPVRVFHWLLAACFTGAYLTAESENWRLLHATLGYTLGALIAFRLVWGLVGTRYARFGSFVLPPSELAHYVKNMLAGRPAHFIGHNPLGGVAIVLMLLAGAAITATGYAVYNDIGGEWLGEAHEAAANGMLVLVGVHLCGVALASWMHRENLPRAMVTGLKQGQPSDGITRLWWPVAIAMVIAVGYFWYLQWRLAP
jgi:cytochrome b